MADLQKIVVERLAELDRNPFEAARIGGLERSFVNDIVIGKKTSIRGANMAKLAFGLDWPVARLMNNAEQFDGHTFVVSVMGRIGAGAEIMPEFEQVPPEGLYEIAVQFPVGAEALAFEVDGDSMYPRYDAGDVVICGREGMDAQEIVGWEAAVRTADGRRFLKRIRRGSAPGLFNLESHNASPIEDVRIDWAAEIEHVVRRGKWKKLDEAAQKRLITRTMKGKKR